MSRFNTLKTKIRDDIDILVDDYIEMKISENEKFIEFSYYDLKIKFNLTEDEIQEFLRMAKNDLEINDYDVYFTGAKYRYKNMTKMVESNKFMIAIKG